MNKQIKYAFKSQKKFMRVRIIACERKKYNNCVRTPRIGRLHGSFQEIEGL